MQTETALKLNSIAKEIKGLPFFGTIYRVRRDPPLFLREIMRTHGSVVPLRIGPQRLIMAGHPEAVKHVAVTNSANYCKEKYVDKLKPIFGDGLITSNGETWQTTRSVVQRQMTMPAVQQMLQVMDEVIREDVSTWRGNPVDLARQSSSTTLRVLCMTMFGQADSIAVGKIVEAMDTLQAYFSKACWALVDIDRLLNTKLYREFNAARETVFEIVRKMISDRRHGEPKHDLLQGLIEAHEIATSLPLSDKRILDEIVTSLIAGHETTGATLAFAWEKLAQNPNLQKNLREEAFRCLPLDGPPTAANLRDMVLTNSFVKEVMRLNPAVWWVARTAIAEDDIMGVKVRPGDVVMITPYVTHRIEEFWDDPESFKADRFVNHKPSHSFAYIPFSAGPRVCPGVHMATLEMQLAVGRLLQQAEITGTSDAKVEGLITLRPGGGMPLTVKAKTTTVTVKGVEPGEHALVDTYSRLRAKVFVQGLGWPLRVDEEGRELDQFDNKEAEYSLIVSGGQIKSYGRLLPCGNGSLLFDVYGHLIEDQASIDRHAVLEGTRLGTAPDVPARERGYWLKMLIDEASERAVAAGIDNFCSVSDVGMERVLKRAGIRTERLGAEVTDQHGFDVMALKLDCKSAGKPKFEPMPEEAIELQSSRVA